MPYGLTREEGLVLNMLGDAWDMFIQLPEQHPAHNQEFMQAIHAAQRIVMCRPIERQLDSEDK